MAYIGNIPAEKYQTLQKQSFTTSATDTYTLDYAVTNPQDLALFINNVRQNPNDAYSVSNTTLTLSSAITSSDTMYAVFLGRAVETIAPATGSVTNAMLAGSIATSKLADGSTFATTNGITEADNWRVNANFNPSTGTQVITSNWERVDTDAQGYIGTGMTESSGIFTFPSTGYYLVCFTLEASHTATSHYITGAIQTTEDNSSYNAAAEANFHIFADGNRYYAVGSCMKIVDVTDTSQIKVRFTTDIQASGVQIDGGNGANKTVAHFIRLGDT